ncbi:hypothetical protein [Aquipuribacter sp. MA13-6]|uniref:hypothetical protein n=1 Tax=unclassified Aquipuribacter TaxID=2635084 RepID=UPI003EEC90A5
MIQQPSRPAATGHLFHRPDPRPAVVRPRTGDDDFDHAWQRALDDLEVDVERAEAMLRDSHEDHGGDQQGGPGPDGAPPRVTWTAPRLDTPLPDSMRERAERILERQLLVTGRLSTAMTSSRRHMEVVDRLVPSDARPMYVDQAL